MDFLLREAAHSAGDENWLGNAAAGETASCNDMNVALMSLSRHECGTDVVTGDRGRVTGGVTGAGAAAGTRE